MMNLAVLPAGVILAGGRSSRMAGQSKALLDLNGSPLLQHVIQRMLPQVSSLLLSVERENAQLRSCGLPQVADIRQGNQGPLGGLLAAMEALPQGSDCLLLVPCDAPFLPLDLGQRLAQERALHDRAACMVRYENELQPTFSLWHRRLLPDLRHAVLDDGLAGFKQFLDRIDLAILDWESAQVSPFFNINTPADLARASLLLESGLCAGPGVPT
jgi:molybdopterin-guanine dinucleotide biosynthesis protein A